MNSSKLWHIPWHSTLNCKFHFMTGFRDSVCVFCMAEIIGPYILRCDKSFDSTSTSTFYHHNFLDRKSAGTQGNFLEWMLTACVCILHHSPVCLNTFVSKLRYTFGFRLYSTSCMDIFCVLCHFWSLYRKPQSSEDSCLHVNFPLNPCNERVKNEAWYSPFGSSLTTSKPFRHTTFPVAASTNTREGTLVTLYLFQSFIYKKKRHWLRWDWKSKRYSKGIMTKRIRRTGNWDEERDDSSQLIS